MLHLKNGHKAKRVLSRERLCGMYHWIKICKMLQFLWCSGLFSFLLALQKVFKVMKEGKVWNYQTLIEIIESMAIFITVVTIA